MDPTPSPPLSAAAAAAAVDSAASSPRSRADSFDDTHTTNTTTTTSPPKLRLMCSFGGHIVPRPHDKSLCYIGGDTRIVVVDRNSSLVDLTNRLSKTLLNNKTDFTLKYQLPNEDLDSLISVTTDEDLDNMIDEYDRLNSNNTLTTKSSRLRLFLFPIKPDSVSSIGSLLENSIKSEDWFLSALNGTNSGGLSDSNSVNCLLGLDDDVAVPGGNNSNSNRGDHNNNNSNNNNIRGDLKGVGGISAKSNINSQDVHSVPDSPMVETHSSFGSANSSPSLGNLPPIKLHVEDQVKVMRIEEQSGQIGIGGNVLQQQQQQQKVVVDDGAFVVLAPPEVGGGVQMSSVPVVMGEYMNRVYSDDERSEQGGGGVAMGYRKQLQQQQQQQSVPSQLPQKAGGGGGTVDLASPDSVSSDGSLTNPLSRQKAMIYQDPNVQVPVGQHTRVFANPTVEQTKIADLNSQVQMQQQQQFQDTGYVLATQYDPQHHPQLQQQQQQQPQFIHTGTQYIQHHPTGAVPMSYFPVYHPSQQSHLPHHSVLDQQYPVYYVQARQPQAYTMPVQQSGYSEGGAVSTPSSCPQTPPPVMAAAPPAAAYNTSRNAPTPKSEMPAGMYRTATTAAPNVVQVPSGQHQAQYVGFSQMHHPSQSVAPPTLGATANYAYEFADPAQAHMYYNQPLAPQMAAQYQTMSTAMPEAASHPSEGIKQQVRTSQPL